MDLTLEMDLYNDDVATDLLYIQVKLIKNEKNKTFPL